MATQQFGYGPNVWAPAKGTGAVDISTLAQPGGAKPEFKPQNEYAALAAKMVGELAYGAMAEGMAPEYVGFDETLRKDIYRRKPGSAQFAPEGGWMLPNADSAWESDVPMLLKKYEIMVTETDQQFELDRFNPPEGLEDRGPIDIKGNYFSPSLTEALIPTTIEQAPVEVQTGTPVDWDPKTSPQAPDFKGLKNGIMGTWSYIPSHSFAKGPNKPATLGGNWGHTPDPEPEHYGAGSRGYDPITGMPLPVFTK